MTKTFLIPVDRSTVRPNPHGGQSVFYRHLGTQVEISEDHVVVTSRVQPLYLLSPTPAKLFEYVPTEVECGGCGEKFPHTELKEDWEEYGDECSHSDTICPKCGQWHCCQLKYEPL